MRAYLGILYILFFIFFSNSLAFGQVNSRPTQKELHLQALLIDAGQQKSLGNFEKAISILQSILEEDPGNHVAAYEMARVYEALDDDEKAQAFIERALKGEENTWYLVFQGELFEKLEQPANAARVYQKLTQIEPENDFYYLKQAFFLVSAKEINDAIKVYDALEKRIGVAEEIIRKKYNLYLSSGKSKKAEEELLKLIKYYPNNKEYYHQLALFYQEEEQWDSARETYEKILTIDPLDSKAKVELSKSYHAKNDESSFFDQLKRLFEDPSVNIDGKIKAILPSLQSIADNQDQQKAFQFLELSDILLNQYPNNAKALSLNGDLLFYAEKLEEASYSYEKALALKGNNYSIWEQLLLIYLQTGNYEKLKEKSIEATDFFPNQPLLYYLNGRALFHLNEFSEAESILQQGLFMSSHLPPLQADIYSLQGAVLMMQNKSNEAKEAFEFSLNLMPENALLKARYAYYLALKTDQLDKAEELLSDLDAAIEQPIVLQAKGWLAYRKNDFEQSSSLLDKAIKQSKTPTPELLEQYGDCLFNLGTLDEAVNFWEKAQQAGSMSPVLQKKISDKKLYD